MNCWYHLNLNVDNAIREDWTLPVTNANIHGMWQLMPENIFRKEWLEYIETLGLTLDDVMLFYRPAGLSSLGAHVDIAKADPLELSTYAVNWIIGGKDSEMIWYEMPAGDLEIRYTEANTPFSIWNCDSLVKVDSCEIREKPTLVRVDIPHSITVRQDSRWCISARPTFTDKVFDWNKTVNRFKSTGLLVDRNSK